jgi:two-component system, OmpR family, response regulator TctD
MNDHPFARVPWLDRAGRQFFHPEGAVTLRRREFAILEILLRHAGEVLSRETIAEHVFGPQPSVGANAVELYVARLRKQLRGSGLRIHTLRGLGYMIVMPGQDNHHASRPPA